MAITCPKCHSENPETKQFCADCGTQLRPSRDIGVSVTKTLETTPHELARGILFAGRYEIIEELGAGGMGKVYRVHDIKLNEEVALKLIKPAIAADSRVVARFRNELKTARKIRHENVCGMYDLHEEGRILYLTMEYVRGEDLRSLIHRMKALPVGTAVSIARQIAEGLGVAHKLGIIHRDLKPGNVMIDKEGNAKIMDFGIARILAVGGTTAEGAIIGTPEYMSPEQVDGKEADQRSDIYALGIILFEMVTGRAPFEGETPLSVAHKHKYEPAPDPRKLNPQIPGGLSHIILRSLEKTKEERYQTTEELLSDLTAVEQSFPIAEHIAPKRKTLTPRTVTVKFQPRKLVVAAAAVLILALAGFFLWRKVIRPTAPPPPSASATPTLAILYFENKSGDPKLDSWRDMLSELLITSLSQSKYVRVITGEEIYAILKRLGLADARKYSSDDIEKIAAQTGATHVLRGSFIKAGESFIITAGLQRPDTRESPPPIQLEASSEKDIIVKVDELTRRVKEGLNLTSAQIASDVEKEAGEVTTSSPEALRYYIEGRRRHQKMEFKEELAYMEKAVEIDPAFAMAYRAMAGVTGPAAARKYLRKALELSDHLTELERLQIECQQFQWDEDLPKALEVAERIVKSYPQNVFGHMRLGGIYTECGEFDKAIEELEFVAENLRTPLSVGNLAGAYWNKGLYQKAADLCRSFLQDVEDNADVHLMLSISYLGQRQFDLALAEAERLSLSRPDDLGSKEQMGDVLLLKGDIAGAEKVYQQISQKDPLAARGALTKLALIQGKYAEALRLNQQGLDHAIQHNDAWGISSVLGTLIDISIKCGRLEDAKKFFAQQLQARSEARKSQVKDGLPYLPRKKRDDLYDKGLTQARLGLFDEARKTAEELKVFIDKAVNPQQRMRYEMILGLVEFGNKNYGMASELFGKACSRLLSEQSMTISISASTINYFARALYESGDLEKARENYEKITLLTIGRVGEGDIYAKAFYMLGKIAEKKGDKVKARENYEKFLSLWKDANPGLPEVEDAKMRLGGLKG